MKMDRLMIVEDRQIERQTNFPKLLNHESWEEVNQSADGDQEA